VGGAWLALSSGNHLEITVNNPGEENIYVRSVTFNGRALPDYQITARELMQGGSLVFEMTGSP